MKEYCCQSVARKRDKILCRTRKDILEIRKDLLRKGLLSICTQIWQEVIDIVLSQMIL